MCGLECMFVCHGHEGACEARRGFLGTFEFQAILSFRVGTGDGTCLPSPARAASALNHFAITFSIQQKTSPDMLTYKLQMTNLPFTSSPWEILGKWPSH